MRFFLLARLFEEKKSRAIVTPASASASASGSVVFLSESISRNSKSKRGNNSNKMLDGVVFSCQQIGVNTFYKCNEFQVNSFDS
jgi:hypothetical protein